MQNPAKTLAQLENPLAQGRIEFKPQTGCQVLAPDARPAGPGCRRCSSAHHERFRARAAGGVVSLGVGEKDKLATGVLGDLASDVLSPCASARWHAQSTEDLMPLPSAACVSSSCGGPP
ncbi:MAG: hypothetical protein IPN53_04290 [Comamonadaceae bacterium]|nr:hypothetical protein [Comamonadaceae bacterium]